MMRTSDSATDHKIFWGNARHLSKVVAPKSVHLVVTSPPYWNLKEYAQNDGQLGNLKDYELFLGELDKVWGGCFDALVPGGRMCVVVGDVCLSRRRNGRHCVIPLHADIQVHARQVGFDTLAPIIWHKIANCRTEMDRPSYFLGKPYEPNAIIKNDIEFILLFRKAGEYRHPTEEQRARSRLSRQEFSTFFQQIWDIKGASTRRHPAPFPEELASRLIRMFSFVGDIVLDPFVGTGTTCLAALKAGRSSIGFEIDQQYIRICEERLGPMLLDRASVNFISLQERGHPRIRRRSRSLPVLRLTDLRNISSAVGLMNRA
jgi:site-specific DNA-methyltransferase (adenine-specific)